jgi:excinuclease ABC subunit A
MRTEIERYMTASPCQVCDGKRLKAESLAVTLAGMNIIAVTDQSVLEAVDWVHRVTDGALVDIVIDENGVAHSENGAVHPEALEGRPAKPHFHLSAKGNPIGDDDSPTLSDRDMLIGRQILKEIEGRLRFLHEIGLDYITLSRTAGTLSGGEAQRIRLATQIGSGLMGVLYVCDEPSVGLHAVDNHRLITTLQRLRDIGNTVIIVEHDEAIMRAADHIVDMGPGAGEHGGRVVAEGQLTDILESEESLTGAYLSGRREIPVPTKRRKGSGKHLVVRKAEANNLRAVDVKIPLGQFICVTGVSGSGKSTLVYDVLYKWLAQQLYRAKDRPGKSKGVEGLEHIDKVVNIDQSPIGRTPRSNPATYTGTFTPIRELFSALPEAKARGYGPGRFSFNVKGGRCEACSGDGYIQIAMQFLPDVTVPCDVCNGKRYNEDALEIKFKDKNIAEVLDMTVTEAHTFFEAFSRMKSKLETLEAVGLGYIRLGQPATTLSGGEAQRVKLATELSKRATGKTLYILDEPTTGLAFDDCAHLLTVLHRLVDAGNTVLLIEHHMDMIKNADWLIDMGPGAGWQGGSVVVTGAPEKVAQYPESYTGQYLAPVLMQHGWSPNGTSKANGTKSATKSKAKAGAL